MMYYNVKIYDSLENYDNYKIDHYFSGFYSMKDAIEEGKLWLPDHEVVVVLSSDDEEIEVLVNINTN